MWLDPWLWLQDLVAGVRRDALVGDLHRLSDHLLDDIGLRREQLDLLRLKPPAVAEPRAARVRRPVARPSLQGCG